MRNTCDVQLKSSIACRWRVVYRMEFRNIVRLRFFSCFVIAVREEVLEKHKALLKEMCAVVNKKALEVKKDENTVEIISWRYNLRSGQVENWLIETDWNYDGIEYPLDFDKTIKYLLKLNLLNREEAEGWQQKLF